MITEFDHIETEARAMRYMVDQIDWRAFYVIGAALHFYLSEERSDRKANTDHLSKAITRVERLKKICIHNADTASAAGHTDIPEIFEFALRHRMTLLEAGFGITRGRDAASSPLLLCGSRFSALLTGS